MQFWDHDIDYKKLGEVTYRSLKIFGNTENIAQCSITLTFEIGLSYYLLTF